MSFMLAVFLLMCAYFGGGFGAGIVLLAKYFKFVRRKEGRLPWSVLLGSGWGMLLMGVVGSLLFDPSKPTDDVRPFAALAHLLAASSFGLWLLALYFYVSARRKRIGFEPLSL